MNIPDYCKDIEAIKNRLNYQHVIISTFLYACGGIPLIARLDKDTKLSDGTNIWDHITISKGKNPFGERLLRIDEKAQEKVMFNLHPESHLFKNITVSTAVKNIIAHREKQQKTFEKDLEK